MSYNPLEDLIFELMQRYYPVIGFKIEYNYEKGVFDSDKSFLTFGLKCNRCHYELYSIRFRFTSERINPFKKKLNDVFLEHCISISEPLVQFSFEPINVLALVAQNISLSEISDLLAHTDKCEMIKSRSR